MAMLQLGPVTSLQTGHGLEPFLFQGGFAVSVFCKDVCCHVGNVPHIL